VKAKIKRNSHCIICLNIPAKKSLLAESKLASFSNIQICLFSLAKSLVNEYISLKSKKCSTNLGINERVVLNKLTLILLHFSDNNLSSISLFIVFSFFKQLFVS
jgi:hypothetical protein